MKKAKTITSGIIILALIITIIISVILLSRAKEFENLKNTPLNLPENFTYTAHTGCVDTPDNSLEAIEIGAEHGAGIVEFDLNFTADKAPVLSHDDPTGKEITLDQAFKKVSEFENLKVNVDLKSFVALEKILPLAEKHGIKERIFFTGVREENVEVVKKACPDTPYYLNIDVKKPKNQTEEYLFNLVKTVSDCGAVGINFNKDNATKELVDKFHENGLEVSVWTVDKERDLYEILSLAPDNITTRNPHKLEEILKK